MNISPLVKKLRVPLIIAVLFVGSTAMWLFAAPVETRKAADDSEHTKAKSQKQLFRTFAATLTQATLVGNFTETGKGQEALREERYEIESVEHVEGEMWLFKARITYGEKDVTLPLTLPVRWAGDTPVICVDNMGFPGLGTYTARVMIYSDHYAGFWNGENHGGHLFGLIKRGVIETP